MFSTKEFWFENFGPLGVNLKACLNYRGAFIDSFQVDGHGDRITSLAATKGMQVGDVLVSLNGQNVTSLELNDMKNRLITFRHQKLNIVIDRPSLTLGISPYKDPRHRLSLKRFFQERMKIHSAANVTPCREEPDIQTIRRLAVLNDLYFQVFEISLFLPNSCYEMDAQVYAGIKEILLSCIAEANDLQLFGSLPQVPCDILNTEFLQQFLSILLKELECPRPWNWMSEYHHSAYAMKKVSYFHRYPGVFVEYKPIFISLLGETGLLLFFCWYCFLSTQQRVSFGDIHFYQRYFLHHIHCSLSIQNQFVFFSELFKRFYGLLLEEEGILLQFLESELYLYYHFWNDGQRTKQGIVQSDQEDVQEQYFQYCFRKIITLPDSISRHFPFQSSDCDSNQSEADTHEKKDKLLPKDLVLSITQFTTTMDDTESSDELVIRKSFLANAEIDSHRKEVDTNTHPYFSELRKVLGLSLVPQARELLSLLKRNPKSHMNSFVVRDLLLESFATDVSIIGATSNVGKEFYYGSQVIILPSQSNKSFERESEDVMMVPMNLHFFESMERDREKGHSHHHLLTKDPIIPISTMERIPSFSTESFVDSDEEEGNEKINNEFGEEKLLVPRGLSFLSASLLNTTHKLSQWGARYRSSSSAAIQEDWLTIQEKIINPLKSSLPATSSSTSVPSTHHKVISSPSQVLSCFGGDSLNSPLQGRVSPSGSEVGSEENNDMITPNRLTLKLQKNLQEQQMRLLSDRQNITKGGSFPSDCQTSLMAMTLLSKEASVAPQLQFLLHRFIQSLEERFASESLEKCKSEQETGEQRQNFTFHNLFNRSIEFLLSPLSLPLDSTHEQEKLHNYDVLLEVLPVPLLVTLYFAALLETKIMIIIPSRSSLSILPQVLEDDSIILSLWYWLQDCLHPLAWQYPFTTTLLPEEAATEIIQCPVAYFCGITTHTLLHMKSKGIIELTSSTSFVCNDFRDDDHEIMTSSNVVSNSIATARMVHNIENLLLIDLSSREIIFPQSLLLSSELRILQTIYRKAHDLNPNFSSQELPFPLVTKIQSLLLPQSQRYCENKYSSLSLLLPSSFNSSLSVKTLLQDMIQKEFNLLSSNDMKSYERVNSFFFTPSEKDKIQLIQTATTKTSQIIQLYFQGVTKEILFGLEDCLFPVVFTKSPVVRSTNNASSVTDANTASSALTSAKLTISQVLLHQDLFYERKCLQLLQAIDRMDEDTFSFRSYQTNLPMLLFPSLGPFLQSFVQTQSLSELITRLSDSKVLFPYLSRRELSDSTDIH